jgi:hypothetical protein
MWQRLAPPDRNPVLQTAVIKVCDAEPDVFQHTVCKQNHFPDRARLRRSGYYARINRRRQGDIQLTVIDLALFVCTKGCAAIAIAAT